MPNTSAIVKRYEEGRASDGSALFDTNRMAVNTVLCEGEEKAGSKKRAVGTLR
jgi:hypothetical protein